MMMMTKISTAGELITRNKNTDEQNSTCLLTAKGGDNITNTTNGDIC